MEAALDLSEGVHYVGKPEGWGLEMGEKFTAEDYHHPSDKVSHTVTSAAPPRIGSFSERSANAAQMQKPTQPGKPVGIQRDKGTDAQGGPRRDELNLCLIGRTWPEYSSE